MHGQGQQRIHMPDDLASHPPSCYQYLEHPHVETLTPKP